MPRSSRRVRGQRAGTLRLLLVFATLVGVNVYIFLLRGGTSIGALLQSTRVSARVRGSASPTEPIVVEKPSSAPKVTLQEDPQGGHVREIVLGDGQTIAQALTPLVGKRQATALETTFGASVDLASIRAGQALTLIYDEDERLAALEFRATPTSLYRVDVKKTALSRIEGKADVRVADLLLPAGAGMWDALRHAGESPVLGERLAELFGGEESLVTASSAERLRVVVEKRYVAGRFQRYGRILGADWVSRVGLRRAFAWGALGGESYTDRGEGVARRYLVSPLRPSRTARHVANAISEGRYGIDWTCGPNSIVRAVAEGTVTALTRGKEGSTMTLELSSDERVVYSHVMHPSRLVALGGKVSQGFALGRTDGGVTLTYEGPAATAARVMEEARVPAARAAALSAADRPRFGESIAPTLERLRGIAVRAADPLAVRALGAMP